MPKESTVHKFSDLPDLREVELEPWGLPKNSGLCVMGNSHVDQGIESVMVLMQHSAKKAKRELQENFRKLMDT